MDSKVLLFNLLTISSLLFNVNAQFQYGCTEKPCLNGGTCVDQPNIGYGYNCICPNQYYGINCQLKTGGNVPIIEGGNININFPGSKSTIPSIGNINFGDVSYCLNGGKYIKDGLPCLCPNGFSGTRCEISPFKIGYCTPSPCFNNGICKTVINGFICHCPNSFYGQRCEFIKPYTKYSSSRIVGVSLGSILPTLVLIILVCCCLYVCLTKRRRAFNETQFVQTNRSDGFTNFFNRPAPFFNQQAQNRQYQMRPGNFPDPDQVFKVNQAPPSYEEIVNNKNMQK